MLTDDAKGTQGNLNPGLPWQKQQIGLKFKEETSNVLHLEYSFVRYWNLDTLENRSELPVEFWNVVSEKNGNQLDRLYENWRNVTNSQGGGQHPTNNKKEEG